MYTNLRGKNIQVSDSLLLHSFNTNFMSGSNIGRVQGLSCDSMTNVKKVSNS